MTQGHEAHGDGGGTEELLIAACGIAHRHHGAGGTLTPAPTCPTPTVAHSEEKMRGGQFSRRSIKLRLRCVFLLRGSHQEGQV